MEGQETLSSWCTVANDQEQRNGNTLDKLRGLSQTSRQLGYDSVNCKAPCWTTAPLYWWAVNEELKQFHTDTCTTLILHILCLGSDKTQAYVHTQKTSVQCVVSGDHPAASSLGGHPKKGKTFPNHQNVAKSPQSLDSVVTNTCPCCFTASKNKKKNLQFTTQMWNTHL